MLAGEPPHIGGSAQQIIMKIITEPAQPVTQFRKSVPPNVAAAVGEGARETSRRSIRECESIRRRAGQRGVHDHCGRRRHDAGGGKSGVSMRVYVATIAVAVVAASAIGWAVRRPAVVPDEPVVRAAIDLQPSERLYPPRAGRRLRCRRKAIASSTWRREPLAAV